MTCDMALVAARDVMGDDRRGLSRPAAGAGIGCVRVGGQGRGTAAARTAPVRRSAATHASHAHHTPRRTSGPSRGHTEAGQAGLPWTLPGCLPCLADGLSRVRAVGLGLVPPASSCLSVHALGLHRHHRHHRHPCPHQQVRPSLALAHVEPHRRLRRAPQPALPPTSTPCSPLPPACIRQQRRLRRALRSRARRRQCLGPSVGASRDLACRIQALRCAAIRARPRA